VLDRGRKEDSLMIISLLTDHIFCSIIIAYICVCRRLVGAPQGRRATTSVADVIAPATQTGNFTLCFGCSRAFSAFGEV
jgi:hypothetical protein